MSKQMLMLDSFKPLFMPNRSAAEMLKFDDPSHRAQLITRMLTGDVVNMSDFGAREFVLRSGRVSGKTQHDEFAAGIDIREGVGDIWYCRSELGDIRSSIFTSMQNTLHSLGATISDGVHSDFRVRSAPFELTHNETNNKIQFWAINKDINRTKGYTAPSGRLKRVMVEEANEPDEGKYIDALITTAVRYFFGNSKMSFRLNPPETKNHWSVKYFNDRIRNGAQEIYTTWIQLAKLGLLTPATVAEALKMKQNDPLLYRYWYLGHMVKLQGLVYPQLDREKHIVNIFKLLHEGDRVSELILGLDEGTANDSTCVTPLAVMFSGRAIVLDCLEIDPQKIGQQAPTEQSRRLYQFLTETLDRFSFLKHLKRRWIFESAEGGQMLKLQFEMDYGEECLLVRNKNVMGDIKRVRSMLQEGILFFHADVNVNTMQLVEDMESYIFDEKTNQVKKGQRDDTIDSLEYATKLYYNMPMSVY